MTRILRKPPRRAVWAGVAAAGAAALLGVRPSRGQQPTAAQPDVQAAIPAAASAGRTRVSYTLTLPPGLKLQDWPAVRVVDANGKLVEYEHMLILQRTPRLTGYFRLWTKTYPAGSYRVTIEVSYQRPDGTTAQFVTPAAPLTVAG